MSSTSTRISSKGEIRNSESAERWQRFKRWVVRRIRIHWYLTTVMGLAVIAIAWFAITHDPVQLVASTVGLLLLTFAPTLLFKMRMRRINRRLGLTWLEMRSHEVNGKSVSRTVRGFPGTGLKHQLANGGYRFIWSGSPGTPVRELTARRAELALELKAFRVQVTAISALEAEIKVYPHDPFAAPPGEEYLQLEPMDQETARSYVGWNEEGQRVYLKLFDQTGISIAGFPGSGKTILLKRLALQAYLGGAHVFLANGKGDNAYQALTDMGIPTVSDSKKEFLVLLEKLENIRRGRMNQSSSSYVVLVADELQEYFTVYSKEEKPLVDQIVALLVNLVRKQRSSQMLLIWGSQKIDSSAIPTALRDLFETRLSGATPSSTVTRTALGDLRETDPQPHDPSVIPGASHGRFVVKGQGPEVFVFQAAKVEDSQVLAAARAQRASSSPGGYYDAPWGMRDVRHHE